ncbi:MAG TPA: acyltransferase family protein [bacterium]|nr:acyltransferase family protein [bacterium]
MEDNGRRPREHYIDWLRAIAVFLLFPYHSAQVFSHFWSYVQDPERSRPLSWLVEFMFQWHMHLLFLVAGMAAFYALRGRPAGVFVKERLLRLLIPLCFGVVVVVPPLKRLALLMYPDYHDSLLRFYLDPRLLLNTRGDVHWAHLWFLAYLLLYSLIALPLFLYLKREGGIRVARRAAAVGRLPGGLMLFALPFGLIEAALRIRWPGGTFNIGDDWATFCLYLAWFVFGYLLLLTHATREAHSGGRPVSLLDALDRDLWFLMPLALISMGLYFALAFRWLLPYRAAFSSYHPMSVGFQFFRGVNSFLWVMTLAGLGRRYLRRGGSALDYLRESSYPVYILHATVIMLIAYFVVKWRLAPLLKFAVILASSLAATMIIYDLMVRRTKIARFLFGMKTK